MCNLKQLLINGNFDADFSYLYGDVSSARIRYENLIDGYVSIFNNLPNRLFSAPGRTEVGGNHTDHQRGCVLTGSVNLDVCAAVSENSEMVVRVKSEGYDLEVIDLSNLEPSKLEFGKSSALIRGVCAEFIRKGVAVKGFNAYATSNVLKGSGLSSSAAFEVLIANIVNNLFNQGKSDAVEIAKIAQKAENVYFGKPCGLLDQMASSVGGFTAIDFENCEEPVIEKVEFDLNKQNFSLVIVNTGGNHADLTDDYAAVPNECLRVASYFGKKVLREVDEALFYDKLSEVRTKTSDRAVLRAIHFFNENKRAILEKEQLQSGDFMSFLKTVKASGDSSFKYLQNVYSSKFPNEQGLSLALALSEQILGDDGAWRVHGGGFAGTIQAFVPQKLLKAYTDSMSKVFGNDSCYILNIRPVGGYELTAK